MLISASCAYADSDIIDNNYYKTEGYQKYKERSARKANPHQKLTGYTGAFYCERCHKGALKEIINTVHYQWESDVPYGLVTDKDGNLLPPDAKVGKRYKIGSLPNTYPMANMLGMIPSPNDPSKKIGLGCGQCHIADGHLPVKYEMATDEQKNSVDCLICHASEYDMSKHVIVNKGTEEKPVLRLSQDQTDAALQSVGRPTAEACMRCHYHVGGGPLFKRGVDYASDVDVHAEMGLLCSDCHTPRPREDHGMVRGPGIDLQNYDHYTKDSTCVKCHSGKVHKEERYDYYGAGRVACVTCHVRSTGGLMERDFTSYKQSPKSGMWLFKSVVKDEHTQPLVYKWWNEKNDGTFTPKGSYKDGHSKLYPFKEFKEKIFVDEKGERLPTKNGLLFMKGEEAIKKAILIAQKQGRFIDGKMEFPEKTKPDLTGTKEITEYFNVSHGVLPKEKALKCADCHGDNPVLDWAALGMKNPKYIK